MTSNIDKIGRRIIVLMDYENIAINAIKSGLVVDFKKLRDEIKQIGRIDFAFVVVPDQNFYALPMADMHNLGFDIIVCPKRKLDSQKLEDAVDMSIIRIGWTFLRYEEITDVVVISNDFHMIELVREAEKQGKEVHLFGLDQISSALKSILDPVKIHKVPLTPKTFLEGE